MAANSAELTLILKAKNLAEIELAKLRQGLGKVADTAKTTATRIAESFRSGVIGDLFRDIQPALGRVATAIATGKGIPQAFAGLGIVAAGSLADSMGANIVDRIAASGFIVKVSAFLTTAGTVAGNALALAISVGMAALPFLLLAAAVAALVYLIHHPEAVQAIKNVAGGIISGIVNGLVGLGAALLRIFGEAFQAVLRVVTGIISRIVGAIGGAIQAVADLLTAINKVPNIPGASQYGKGDHHAMGGWAGLHGPETITVGEQGPEYIRRAGSGTGDGGSGLRVVGVSERDILDMVERGLYFRLRRASPSTGRV